MPPAFDRFERASLSLVALLAVSCASRGPPPPGRWSGERSWTLVLKLIEARGAEGHARLVEAGLASTAPAIRDRAALLLGRLGDPASSAALVRAALDPLPSLRARAVEALAGIPGTKPALIAPALVDPSAEVRGSGARALARLARTDPDESSEVGGAPADREPTPWEPVRDLLVRQLAAETDERAISDFHLLIASSACLRAAPPLRAASIAALGRPNFLAAIYAAEALGCSALSAGAGRAAGDESAAAEALSDLARRPETVPIARWAAVRALTAFRSLPEGSPSRRTAETTLREIAGRPQSDAESVFFRREIFRASETASGTADVFRNSPFRPRVPPSASRWAGPALLSLPEALATVVEAPRRPPHAVLIVGGRGWIRIQVDPIAAPRAVLDFARKVADRAFDIQPILFFEGIPGVGALAGGAAIEAPSIDPSFEGDPAAPLRRGSVWVGESAGGGFLLYIGLLPFPAGPPGRATCIGRVVDGMEVVEKLRPGDRIEFLSLQGFILSGT